MTLLGLEFWLYMYIFNVSLKRRDSEERQIHQNEKKNINYTCNTLFFSPHNTDTV